MGIRKLALAFILTAILDQPIFAQTQDQKIFSGQTPTLNNLRDGVNYELGMRFTATAAGKIKAIRFFKASNETGTHVGRIFSASGQQLASVTFTGETASGWQQQLLSAPLSIKANTEYTVSVNTGNRYYVATTNGLAAQVTSGNLKSVVGNNGVFGPVGSRPGSSWQNSNYFRDIVFAADAAPAPAPSSPEWTNTSFTSQSGSFTIQFDAVPSLSSQDVVVGLSRAAATAFTDLATIVRFGNNGVIDARNGASYSAATSISNVAGRSYRVRMVVNLATKKYSVYVTPQGQSEMVLASNFSFRDSQSSVATLANLARYNASGNVTISNFTVAAASAPVPSPSPSVDCVRQVWANLEACGWPGPKNTGWQPTGVTLRASGSLTITTPGTVIDSLDVQGTIYISANNVTIKRSRVTASTFALVQIKDGVTGARIEDCELNGLGTGFNSMGVYGSATVLRNNIYNVENAVAPGSNSVMQDNYLHDLKGGQGVSGEPHYDNIQIDGGQSNVVIRHNTIHLARPQTSAIMIDSYFGAVDNVLVDNNLLAGGGFTFYAYSEGPAVTNIRHTNNKLSNALYPCVGSYGVWFTRGQPTDGWRRSGNVLLETGFNLDNGNPSVNGQLCN